MLSFYICVCMYIYIKIFRKNTEKLLRVIPYYLPESGCRGRLDYYILFNIILLSLCAVIIIRRTLIRNFTSKIFKSLKWHTQKKDTQIHAHRSQKEGPVERKLMEHLLFLVFGFLVTTLKWSLLNSPKVLKS